MKIYDFSALGYYLPSAFAMGRSETFWGLKHLLLQNLKPMHIFFTIEIPCFPCRVKTPVLIQPYKCSLILTQYRNHRLQYDYLYLPRGISTPAADAPTVSLTEKI